MTWMSGSAAVERTNVPAVLSLQTNGGPLPRKKEPLETQGNRGLPRNEVCDPSLQVALKKIQNLYIDIVHSNKMKYEFKSFTRYEL